MEHRHDPRLLLLLVMVRLSGGACLDRQRHHLYLWLTGTATMMAVGVVADDAADASDDVRVN